MTLCRFIDKGEFSIQLHKNPSMSRGQPTSQVAASFSCTIDQSSDPDNKFFNQCEPSYVLMNIHEIVTMPHDAIG